MVQTLLITLLIFPIYLLLRHPYRKLPLHIDTGFYVSNQFVAGDRLSYSAGWNARFAGGSKVVPELFYSLVYLAYGGKDYASYSRLYFGAYNYLTAIAIGLLAWLLSGGDVLYYYTGLVVYALISSEPHWGGYFESGEQFEVLPQVLAVVCLWIGLTGGSPWWCALAAFIWAAQSFAIKLTSALGFVVLFGAAVWTHHWTFYSVLGGGLTATLAYLLWLAAIGRNFTRLFASMWGLQASQSGHFDAWAWAHRLHEKSRRLADTMLRQPIVPLLAVCGLLLTDTPPAILWWYLAAVAVVYLCQGADIRYYQVPFWPVLALLGAGGAATLLRGSTTDRMALAALLGAWLLYNVVRAWRMNVRTLNIWSWSGALPPETCDRNLALEACAPDVRAAIQERSLLVYGPYNQTYVLTGASYPTSIVCAAHWLDDMAPGWQRQLSQRLVSLPPEAVLDTERCFDAEAVRTELGVDYELRQVFDGDFRLYHLCSPAGQSAKLGQCRSSAPQTRNRLALEELRMTLRTAAAGNMRAVNWGLLATEEWTTPARHIARRVGIPLVFCTADLQTALNRLPEVDVLAVLDPLDPKSMDRLTEAAGRRLIYWPGRFDAEPRDATDDAARLAKLLDDLHAAGRRRIGVYGAGRKTVSLIDTIVASPVEIAAVFDDDTRRQGNDLAGWPIRPLSDAPLLGVEAIVVCSDRFEAPMLRRCRRYERQGITVIGLHRPGLTPPALREDAHGLTAPAGCSP
ncbi:MAG TPA: hypothetical protein VM243_03015 [Phycisphaerae bacterium]|nr:hypothetical protein [Phycisphaerae bacterium]